VTLLPVAQDLYSQCTKMSSFRTVTSSEVHFQFFSMVSCFVWNELRLSLCRWWSANNAAYRDGIIDYTPLVEVFCIVGGRSRGSGSNLLHSSHVICKIFGNMTMHEALSTSRANGFGALARESATVILNAYSRPITYAFTIMQVRMKFRNALMNKDSAFKLATKFEAASNDMGSEESNTEGSPKIEAGAPTIEAFVEIR
jgi:hypothetical protein